MQNKCGRLRRGEEADRNIEQAARYVLEVRNNLVDSSIAALCDPLSVADGLHEAHKALDKTVLNACGLEVNVTGVDLLETLAWRYVQSATDLRG